MRRSGQGECQHREEHSEAFLFCSRPPPAAADPPQQPHRYAGLKEGSRIPTLLSEEASSSEVDARRPPGAACDPERPWRQSCLNSCSMTHAVTEPLLSSPHPPGRVEEQKIHACIREPLRCELEVVPSLFLHLTGMGSRGGRSDVPRGTGGGAGSGPRSFPLAGGKGMRHLWIS